MEKSALKDAEEAALLASIGEAREREDIRASMAAKDKQRAQAMLLSLRNQLARVPK